MEGETFRVQTTEKCVLPAVEHGNLPHIVIGDLNSHITTWRYTMTDGKMEERLQNPTSSLYLKALLTCVENQSWSLSLTRNR